MPEDLGIIGFNDLEMMAAACPPLSSIKTNRYGIGKTAVDMIRVRLEGDEPEKPVVDLGFQLQDRQSTARRI